MHRASIVAAAMALIIMGVVDLLVVRKLPRSRQLPAWFLSYVFFVSILTGAVVALLSRNH